MNKTAKKKVVSFTDDERAAMRERAQELRSESRLKKSRAEGQKALLAKVNEMPEPDRSMAKRIHKIVGEVVPTLMPKTWYGMPAYADKDGKVILFFQSAAKFKARYATLGFSDTAKLDNGAMWPTSFALKKLTKAEEKKIAELVKKAIG